MKASDQDTWKQEALNAIWVALGSHETLRSMLVFKGAQVLARCLTNPRASYDLDANIEFDNAPAHVQAIPEDRQERAAWVQTQVKQALTVGLASLNGRFFTLNDVRVLPRPPAGHPRV
jgi:hypothetical protein